MLLEFIDIFDFLYRCWTTMCELSPWLLLGMFLSGLLHVTLPKNFVRRRFRGYSGVVQSVLLGVPLPLCSCGVIPAGIGLKNDGASDGASVGFLISTPQTGVDSVLVSASFFGWPFAIFKMVTAALTGIVGGWFTEISTDSEKAPSADGQQVVSTSYAKGPWLRELWTHALEVLHSIWLWLLVGVIASALIGTLGFQDVINQVSNAGLLPAMLLMLVIAIPMYVCTTASVPIAAALVQSGLPPAVALVFLMAGPATNLTTMGAVRSRFGWRVLTIYLSTLIVGSFLSAFLFDWVLNATVESRTTHGHHHENWWATLSAIVVLLLIAQIISKRLFTATLVADDSSIELTIEGMHCGSCVNRIETAVGKMDGIESIHIDLKQNKASINGNASLDSIKSTIEAMGFTVG